MLRPKQARLDITLTISCHGLRSAASLAREIVCNRTNAGEYVSTILSHGLSSTGVVSVEMVLYPPEGVTFGRESPSGRCRKDRLAT